MMHATSSDDDDDQNDRALDDARGVHLHSDRVRAHGRSDDRVRGFHVRGYRDRSPRGRDHGHIPDRIHHSKKKRN